MQFTYNPTQEKVLEYAHGIVDNGFEPGILIIDEGWHQSYGTWDFDKIKFPEPEKMVEELHGNARVLRGDKIHLGEHLDRALGEVGKVADGGGNDIKCSVFHTYLLKGHIFTIIA